MEEVEMSPGLFTYGETIIRSFFPCDRLAVGSWRRAQVFFYAYLTETLRCKVVGLDLSG